MKRNKLMSFHWRLYLLMYLIFTHPQFQLNEREEEEEERKRVTTQPICWVDHSMERFFGNVFEKKNCVESIWNFSFCKKKHPTAKPITNHINSQKCVRIRTVNLWMDLSSNWEKKYTHTYELIQRNIIILFCGQTHHSLNATIPQYPRYGCASLSWSTDSFSRKTSDIR